MSKLTDEQIDNLYINGTKHWIGKREIARAIESAATEPLLQRISELEKALKLVQQHHATAWNRGHIAGMAANRMVAQDALNAVKKDAWNNTQLTEALMAAEGRCEELERQLEEARNQALEEAVKVCDEKAGQVFPATTRGLGFSFSQQWDAARSEDRKCAADIRALKGAKE